MKISKIQIKNFKSFQDVTVDLDPDFNVFTGVNNSGKTNLLEAIALWHECFNFLLYQAIRAKPERYRAGHYVFKDTQYLLYTDIKTVRSSNIDDLFYQCDKSQKIELIFIFQDISSEQRANPLLKIGFSITNSHGNSYKLEFLNRQDFDFFQFNQLFHNFPKVIGCSFASPVATIRADERFLTTPQVLEAIQKRESVEVIRNRLYTLHSDQADPQLYETFKRDLSYILFNSSSTQISFFTSSDFRDDVKVIINYKIDNRDIEKDISLLGSGTIQIIVILLNLYSFGQINDLNLILFDEPDSHIHRDIQSRLINTLLRFSETTQIFLTTHNESLIRQVSLHQLFHLENRPQYNYNALSRQELPVEPRFKGIYPSALNPIISSLGNSNGLDFINAVEADKIIFVEGQDDAKAIYTLLQKNTIGINTKKYSFWVMGGVSQIFKDLPSYKTVFQQIKNQETLWSKAFLVFDRDFIEDDHRDKLIEALGSHFKILTYITPSYTFESILLMDLIKLSHLLKKWLEAKKDDINIDRSAFVQSLENHYLTIMQEKLESLDDKYIDDTCHRYANVREQLSKRDFLNNQNPIREKDISLNTRFRRYLKTINDNREFYKMANKNDVQAIINQVTKPYNIEFNIEQDFISLLNLVDRSTWFNEWDFLTKL